MEKNAIYSTVAQTKLNVGRKTPEKFNEKKSITHPTKPFQWDMFKMKCIDETLQTT